MCLQQIHHLTLVRNIHSDMQRIQESDYESSSDNDEDDVQSSESEEELSLRDILDMYTENTYSCTQSGLTMDFSIGTYTPHPTEIYRDDLSEIIHSDCDIEFYTSDVIRILFPKMRGEMDRLVDDDGDHYLNVYQYVYVDEPYAKGRSLYIRYKINVPSSHSIEELMNIYRERFGEDHAPISSVEGVPYYKDPLDYVTGFRGVNTDIDSVAKYLSQMTRTMQCIHKERFFITDVRVNEPMVESRHLIISEEMIEGYRQDMKMKIYEAIIKRELSSNEITDKYIMSMLFKDMPDSEIDEHLNDPNFIWENAETRHDDEIEIKQMISMSSWSMYIGFTLHYLRSVEQEDNDDRYIAVTVYHDEDGNLTSAPID